MSEELSMSMASKLAERSRAGKPVRIGLIGAGKFGSMFLSQAPRAPGLHVAGIADLDIDRARRATAAIGWSSERIRAKSIEEALDSGGSFLTDDANALIAADGIDVIVEATGNPGAGIAHALACCKHGRHVVMVNV
jgi:predicted homoserine dehydrogenase-like protein